MNEMPHSCEKKCSCEYLSFSTQFIVITGGPGAGKTALLEFLRKILCQHVVVLPEAASVLYGGGFWRLNSVSGKIAAQKSIYHIQNETQTLVINEKKWMIALCDRGTLDGIAYWPGEASDFCKQLNTTIEAEYSKYLAVIHLASPTVENGYNRSNPLRIESAVEAACIDRKIGEIWGKHPNYNFIESTTNFMEKVYNAISLINFFLPVCCKYNFTKEKK